VFDVLKNRWQAMATSARVGLVSGIALIFLLLGVASYWLVRDDFQVLFSDLNPQDASAMVSELERMKVPYKFAENGATILVEQELVYKTRMKLMGKGLDLHGAVGMEIFNNNDFGMTDFAQKINYQRALQGELARTIMGFDEVKMARVHLVMPDSGLFKRNEAKPKASISLVMKSGAQLRPEQISGIQRLVAASVPEIGASAVTILDQHGVAVSKTGQVDDAGALVSNRLETKRQIEEYLTRKIVTVLDRVVGPGQAIVSVDASLNFDQMRVTQESVVPLPNTIGQNVGAVIRRRESSNGGDAVGDALATGTSTGRSPAAGGVSSSSESEFANSKRVEQIISEPGGVRRLTVGVMLPNVIDPVELAKLKEVVTMAAGVQVVRGDAIVVYNQTANVISDERKGKLLDSTNPNNEEEFLISHPTNSKATQDTVISILLGLALAVGCFGGAILFFSRRQRSRQVLPLSPNQREQLLVDLKRWASGELV
jgi:flagellar M-ring protein FliF